MKDQDRFPRKLAAILYADVAGYSRLTGEDEDSTHRLLSEHLDFISNAVASHRGRIMHYKKGDALIFPTGRVLLTKHLGKISASPFSEK